MWRVSFNRWNLDDQKLATDMRGHPEPWAAAQMSASSSRIHLSQPRAIRLGFSFIDIPPKYASRSGSSLSYYSSVLVPRSRLAISVARNFAMRSISLTGTGLPRGNRIVPLLILYGVSSSLNATTSRSPAG